MFHTGYDSLSRVTDTWVTPKDKPEEKLEHVETAYDTVTGKPSAVWFADDEAGSKVGYSYFPDGSLREMTYPGGKKQSWTYDNQGRTVTFTDTAGVTTTYTHTDLGQIHTAKTSTGEEVTYGYDTLGRLDRTTRGNGITTSVEWNDRNQPAAITHTRADGGLVSKNTHAYDIRGNLTNTVTETPNTNGEEGAGTTETDYGYDAADRLTSSKTTHPDGSVTETGYTLNAASDVTEEARTTVQAGRNEGSHHRHAGARRGRAPDQADHPHPRRKDQRSPPGIRHQRQPPEGRRRTPSPTPPPDSPTPPPHPTERSPATPTGPPDSAKPPPRVRAGRRSQESGAAGPHEVTAYWTPQAPGASVPETAVEEAADGTWRQPPAGRHPRNPHPPHPRRQNPSPPRARKPATSSTTASDPPPTSPTPKGETTTRYTYTDYGTTTDHPTRTTPYSMVRPIAAVLPVQPPRGVHRNPYTYTGATTDEATGHHYLRSRVYNPTTTHFTTRDTANLLNRYTYASRQPPQVHRPNRQHPRPRRMDQLRRRHRPRPHRPRRRRPRHPHSRRQPRPPLHQRRPPRRHHRPRHRGRHRRLRRLPPPSRR